MRPCKLADLQEQLQGVRKRCVSIYRQLGQVHITKFRAMTVSPSIGLCDRCPQFARVGRGMQLHSLRIASIGLAGGVTWAPRFVLDHSALPLVFFLYRLGICVCVFVSSRSARPCRTQAKGLNRYV